MRIIKQTDAELVIHSASGQKALVLPLVMVGVALLGLIAIAASEQMPGAAILFLAALGAYGLSILYGVLQSETLTLAKTDDEVRCDRKTLFGTKRWQLPLSTLQNVSVGTAKRRYKKVNGNRGIRWSYTLKFVTNDNQHRAMLFREDGDRVEAAHQAIKEFVGSFLPQTLQVGHQPGETPYRMTITPAYQRWRESMFNLQPSSAGGSESDMNQVYGVLMDMGMVDDTTGERWAISMTAFLSGEAAFQPTPGGGVLGCGNDSQVAQVAGDIVQMAQTLLPQSFPMEDRALPEPDLVQFFFLTAGGVYGVAEDIYRLQKKADDPLNTMVNKFGFIRQFAEQQMDK